MIRWNEENNTKLETLFNKGLSDKQIAIELGIADTKYAIGRQRSQLGLVKFKKAYHTSKPKTVKPVELVKIGFVAFYKKDNANHFFLIEADDESKAEVLAKNLLYNQGVKEIYICKPISKLITQHVVKIKL